MERVKSLSSLLCMLQSGTVDKRHAVITFDLYLSRFKVKDLSTTNGVSMAVCLCWMNCL